MWILLRLLIGSIFIVSGLGKILSSYQNFLYVIQAYQVLPFQFEVIVAQVFPWIELFVGAFVLLGLWTPLSLKGAICLFGIFVVVVGQALMRKLSLENCGCFGEWIHLKPQTVIVLDSLSLIVCFLLLRNYKSAKQWGLDSYFEKV